MDCYNQHFITLCDDAIILPRYLELQLPELAPILLSDIFEQVVMDLGQWLNPEDVLNLVRQDLFVRLGCLDPLVLEEGVG